MKYLEFIKEGIVSIAEYPFHPFFRSDFKDMDDTELKKYGPMAYCLYIERDGKPTPIISILGCGGDKKKSMDGFKKHFLKYKPQSFKDILLLLTAYDWYLLRKTRFDPFKTNKKCEGKSPIYSVFNSLLEDSKGNIIWSYQLQNILGMYFHGIEDIVRMRKDINARKADAFKVLEGINIDSKRTLRDYIDARMIFGNVTFPNIRGAGAIYELMVSAGGKKS